MSPTPGGENRVLAIHGNTLGPGSWASPAGLPPLGRLDRGVVCVPQVFAGDPEASRCHLLDGAAAKVAVFVGNVALGVFAPLPRIGLAAQTVHGDGERLVRLGGDRRV